MADQVVAPRAEPPDTESRVGDGGKATDGLSNRRSGAWDVHHAPKNYAMLVCAQVASASFSFAAVWLAARLLGSGGYGRVVAVIAASQAASQLFVNWSGVSLWKYGVEEFVETGRINKAFWTRFWILLQNLLIVVALSPLWLSFLSSLLDLPPRAHLLVLGHLAASAIWVQVQQGLQGAKLMLVQGGLLVVERFLVFIVVLALFVRGDASFFLVSAGYIVAPLLACFIGLSFLGRMVLPVVGIDRLQLRRMVVFSLPTLPASLLGYLSTNYLDAVFITHYLTAEHLGVYAVAYQISGIALQIPLLAGTLLLPLFVTLQAEGQAERANRFVQNALPLVSLWWGIGCGVMAVLGSYLLPLFFGDQFRVTAGLMWPLMAAAALAGPMLMGYLPFSNSRGATYVAMFGAIAAAAVNIVLNYLLIPRFGLMGCAWATAASHGATAVVICGLVHRRVLLRSTWTLQAVLPIAIGAAYASIGAPSLRAMILTVLTSAVMILVHRTSAMTGFRAIKNVLLRQPRPA